MTYQKRVVIVTSAPPSQKRGCVLYENDVLRLRHHQRNGEVQGIRYTPLKFMELFRHPGLFYPPDKAMVRARDCYDGGSSFTTTAKHVDDLRAQGVEVDWFLISAAYGVINADAMIWPYRYWIGPTNPPPVKFQWDLADVLNPKTFSDSGDKGDGRSGQRYEYDLALAAIAPEWMPYIELDSWGLSRAFNRAFYFCDPMERAVDALWWVETGYRAEVPNRFESLALSLAVEVPRFLAKRTYQDREWSPKPPHHV